VPPDFSFSSRIRRSSILTLREDFFQWLRSVFDEFEVESRTCSAACERFIEDADIASIVTTNTPLPLIRI
jgi:hypothetical protein